MMRAMMSSNRSDGSSQSGAVVAVVEPRLKCIRRPARSRQRPRQDRYRFYVCVAGVAVCSRRATYKYAATPSELITTANRFHAITGRDRISRP